jgi:lipopolysaccharide transport system permease protein
MHPWLLLRQMLEDSWAARRLAWRLLLRDISAYYRQTWLGYAWAFLTPLATSVTFIFLSSQGILNVKTDLPYAAFVMIGTLLWQVFIDAVQTPVAALNSAKPMLTKINFPREAILLAGLGMVLFNFLVRLLLFIGVLLYFGVPLTTSLLVFPLAVAALVLTGTAFGLAVAPLGALYGDVGRAVPILGGFWMLLTPVVYPPNDSGIAGMLATWNPVGPLIVTARELATGQSLSALPQFIMISSGAVVACFLGWIAFRLAMPHLIARMGG